MREQSGIWVLISQQSSASFPRQTLGFMAMSKGHSHKPIAMTSDDAEAAKLLACWLILEVLSNPVQWNAYFSCQIQI